MRKAGRKVFRWVAIWTDGRNVLSVIYDVAAMTYIAMIRLVRKILLAWVEGSNVQLYWSFTSMRLVSQFLFLPWPLKATSICNLQELGQSKGGNTFPVKRSQILARQPAKWGEQGYGAAGAYPDPPT